MECQQRDGSNYIGSSVPISGEMSKNLEIYPKSYPLG